MKYCVFPFTIFLSKIFSTSYVSPSLPLPSDIFGAFLVLLWNWFIWIIWQFPLPMEIYERTLINYVNLTKMLGYCEAAGPALAAKRWYCPLIGRNIFILACDWPSQFLWFFFIGSYTAAAPVPIGHWLYELTRSNDDNTRVMLIYSIWIFIVFEFWNFLSRPSI